MYFDKLYVPFLSYKYLIKILFTFFLWKYTIKYVPILDFLTTFQILWGSCAYIFASNVFMFSIWLVYFLAFDDEYALALWPP